MRGHPVRNTRLHARLPTSFLSMDGLPTERIFDSQAPWYNIELGFFVIYGRLYSHALADIRSTVAGDKFRHGIYNVGTPWISIS